LSSKVSVIQFERIVKGEFKKSKNIKPVLVNRTSGYIEWSREYLSPLDIKLLVLKYGLKDGRQRNYSEVGRLLRRKIESLSFYHAKTEVIQRELERRGLM